MSSDQWDPDEQVRVRVRFLDGSKPSWSPVMTRRDAELWLSSTTWRFSKFPPIVPGIRHPCSAAIVPWSDS